VYQAIEKLYQAIEKDGMALNPAAAGLTFRVGTG